MVAVDVRVVVVVVDVDIAVTVVVTARATTLSAGVRAARTSDKAGVTAVAWAVVVSPPVPPGTEEPAEEDALLHVALVLATFGGGLLLAWDAGDVSGAVHCAGCVLFGNVDGAAVLTVWRGVGCYRNGGHGGEEGKLHVVLRC